MISLGVLLEYETSRLWMKNAFNVITFSDSVRDIDDGFWMSILPNWDVPKEIKNCVWHALWKNVLLQTKDKEVLNRLTELEIIAVESGIEEIKRHWENERNQIAVIMRRILRDQLEGVDIYWKTDKHECFGKMHTRTYPFRGTIAFDKRNIGKEVVLQDPEDIERLIKLNLSPAIAAKRQIRHQSKMGMEGSNCPLCRRRQQQYETVIIKWKNWTKMESGPLSKKKTWLM